MRQHDLRSVREPREDHPNLVSGRIDDPVADAPLLARGTGGARRARWADEPQVLGGENGLVPPASLGDDDAPRAFLPAEDGRGDGLHERDEHARGGERTGLRASSLHPAGVDYHRAGRADKY